MTYVISDIHGMYDKYAEILRQIDFKESDRRCSGSWRSAYEGIA